MVFVWVEIPAKMIQETLDNFPNFQKLSEVYHQILEVKIKYLLMNRGITDNPEDIMEGLLRKRRNDIISKEISIINN